MAKEDANEHVKLGANAASFSCPTTGFNLISADEIKELLPTFRASKKVQSALRGGHLVVAKESEVKAYKADQKAKAENPEEEEEDEDEEDKILDPVFLKTKSKASLVKMALEVLEEEDDEDAKSIEKMNKDQLVEFIISKNEESQEDEEEEDDEE